MDGFWAFICWTVVTCGIAFSVGRFVPQDDLVGDCAQKGEAQIRSTFIQCKPVASMVDGRRMEIRE